MLKTKKTSIDKVKAINWIQPTDKAVQLFGISKMPMELYFLDKIFLFVEPSGIIRQGITLSFYYCNMEYFKRIEKPKSL